MKELLNKLIKRGWKPFGVLGKARNSVYTNNYFFFEGCADGVTLRQLTSKESGLWQFCCKNKMVKGNGQYESSAWIRAYEDERDSEEYTSEYGASTAEFYLLESALKDESELEDFLLSNIKVEGNEK